MFFSEHGTLLVGFPDSLETKISLTALKFCESTHVIRVRT